MDNKKEKSESFKKIVKKKQEHILGDVTKNYVQTIEHGKQIGKESIVKINQITNNTADFLKSQEYLKTLKINSLKLREKGLEQTNILKKKSPKFYKKFVNAFFLFFELLVGRIKLGTQYGASSLEILEKLAKLKELGIITDKEFNEKKKKILDRI
ncbi:MAG: SHOCT domain-containing protein [Nitrosopumilus sp.]|nr:SHOCT domain-containing protein [Nitrosopumilus sp.]